MSAADHLHPEQLRMFMSVNDIKAAGYEPHEAHSAQQKVAEADAWGLTESIQREGVRTPISLAMRDERNGRDDRDLYDVGLPPPLEGRVLANGHHRFYAQETVDPNQLMPVIHHETMNEGISAGVVDEAKAHLANPDLPSQFRAKGLDAHRIMRALRHEQ